MKITRTINGEMVEIELTSEEMFKAGKEQEVQNLYNDIKYSMKNYLDDDEYNRLIDNEDFIKCVTEDIQDQMDYRNVPFDDALEYAIENFKDDYLQ